MLLNLNNVNTQMQQLADYAVTAAKENFNISLDYSENSLHQLEVLLQQAHERCKQVSSGSDPQKISIDNTVRVWGSYFGEVIRRSLGGDWIVDQSNVYLQLGSKRLNPLGQVRSWIKIGTQHDIQGYFEKLSKAVEQYHSQPENEPLAQKSVSGIEPSIQTARSSWNKCPFCGREYQGINVTYCPNCGKGLGDVASTNLLQKKKDLVTQITNTEVEISQAQEEISSFDMRIEKMSKAQGNAIFVILVGLILIPAGVGVIILIMAFIGMIVGPISRRKLEDQRDDWLVHLNKLRKRLIYLRGELAII